MYTAINVMAIYAIHVRNIIKKKEKNMCKCFSCYKHNYSPNKDKKVFYFLNMDDTFYAIACDNDIYIYE